MLEVYFGDADREKDKFLFDQIASRMPSDVFLMVPDQFTLQAEKNALECMNAEALLELEVISRSGFARRILAQEGRPAEVPVDKYGRFMLLSRLLLKEEDEGGIFSAVKKKTSFISMMNDIISDMKQYEVDPEELSAILEEFSDDEILCEKLKQVQRIYSAYSEAIQGKYTDSEDLLRVVSEKIRESEMVKKHEFWIDGFDYMTPKLLSMVEAIVCTAPKVSIVFTGDDRSEEERFAIFRRMRGALREMAERNNIAYREFAIPEKYKRVSASPEICLTACGDFYSEAETAAIRIMELVRDRGFRYRDVVIICNDAEVRGSVFRRVFDRYGIPLFLDRKRGILHDPAVEFIFAMMDVIKDGRRFHDVFRMVKTGYSPVDDDACEELENYCSKYHIRSGRWKKPFIYGKREEGEEKLERLNGYRQQLQEFMERAETLFSGKKTVREKTEALWIFLTETAEMPQRIDAAREALERDGKFEYAESTAQIWQAIVSIFDQIVEILGEEELSADEYVQILMQGFSEVEIGLLPPTNDQVIFGTMQRTRTGRIRALFLCGANEGVLPENTSSWGIFSEEEKQLIGEKNRRICGTDELRDMEQQLAMYKTISKAEEYLFVSWAEIDAEGTELRPSELVGQLSAGDFGFAGSMGSRAAGMVDTAGSAEAVDTANAMDTAGAAGAVDTANAMDTASAVGAANTAGAAEASGVRKERDIPGSGDALRLVQSKEGALPYLTDALRRAAAGGRLDPVWKTAAAFYDGDEAYESVKQGLFFDNRVERLERETVRKLYGRGASQELILSVSSFERFSRCPFSFLVSYGLRPEEERSFEVDVRSIGEIYHSCLMRLSEYLTEEGKEITDASSRWMTVEPRECKALIDSFVDEFADSYREGVFLLKGRDAYVRSRVKEVCYRTAWVMICQVRSGRTKAIYFEKRFGRRADAVFPPIRIDLGEEGDVLIEGVIDRVDILSVPGEDGKNYVRVIDYKSGSERFDMEEVQNGFRLQLMLYLKGAMGGIEESCPAGVFYFRISDEMTDVSDVAEAQVEETVRSALEKNARLDGVLLNEERVIDSMDHGFSGSSGVIPVRRKKDGTLSGSTLLSEEEFSQLLSINDENLGRAAADFLTGCADIAPRKGKKTDACRYCGYRSICNIK